MEEFTKARERSLWYPVYASNDERRSYFCRLPLLSMRRVVYIYGILASIYSPKRDVKAVFSTLFEIASFATLSNFTPQGNRFWVLNLGF